MRQRFINALPSLHHEHGAYKWWVLANIMISTFMAVLDATITNTALPKIMTSFGISTLHLAAALRDNGGGRLITSEFEPSKVARARDNLTAAGLIDLLEIREGDAGCRRCFARFLGSAGRNWR